MVTVSAWADTWTIAVPTGIAVLSALAALQTWRISKQSLKMALATSGTMEYLLKADEFFCGRPELRPYFYDGWPPPPDVFEPLPPSPAGPLDPATLLRNELLAAAEYYLDILECVMDNVLTLPVPDRESYQEWIHDMVETGPVLQGFLDRYPDWYPTMTSYLRDSPCTRQHVHSYWTTVAARAAAVPRQRTSPEWRDRWPLWAVFGKNRPVGLEGAAADPPAGDRSP